MSEGTYTGVIWGSPFWLGGGAYIDSNGHVYPQLYIGTPRWSVSRGSSSDIEGVLKGFSTSVSFGAGPMRTNLTVSGSSIAVGLGTPGAGVTYGFSGFSVSELKERMKEALGGGAKGKDASEKPGSGAKDSKEAGAKEKKTSETSSKDSTAGEKSKQDSETSSPHSNKREEKAAASEERSAPKASDERAPEASGRDTGTRDSGADRIDRPVGI